MEQRKIKFRIWNKKTNMWEFDYEKLGGVNLFGEIHAMGYFSIVDLNDFIPMQYTGLKDKNGREIYEGDIVKVFDWGGSNSLLGVSVIEWDIDEHGFRINPNQDIEDYYDERRAPKEIIGNIYENPELLK